MVLAAASCGGSSSSSPFTRAELTAKANAICQRVIAAVDWSKVSPQELPSVVSRLASMEERAADELNALVPPASMTDEWRLVVDGFRLTGPEFRKIAEKVKASPLANSTLPLSNAQHERALQANLLHIEDCARY
jgi:hypothetical protein